MHLGVFPVEGRLLAVKKVQVPLAGRSVALVIPLRGRPAENRFPVVRGVLSVTGTGSAVLLGALHVAVLPWRTWRGSECFPEPHIFVGSVVWYQVINDFQAALVSFLQHGVEVSQGTEEGIYLAVIRYVIACVGLRGL